MRWTQRQAETQAETEGEVMEDLIQYPDEVTIGQEEMDPYFYAEAVRCYSEWWAEDFDKRLFEALSEEPLKDVIYG